MDTDGTVGTDLITRDETDETVEIRSQQQHARKNRFLWSATGLYLVSLIFFTVHAAVERSMIFEANHHDSVENLTLPLEQQPLYRHSNLRHRRLNQEREREDDHPEHATSYAQRHYTSGGNRHYYYGNGYGFMEQQEGADDVHRRYNAPKTNLSDVWLCLLTTLGCVVVV